MPSFEMVTNLNCELTSSWRDIVWLEFQTGNWQNGSVDLLPSSSLNLAYRTTRKAFEQLWSLRRHSSLYLLLCGAQAIDCSVALQVGYRICDVIT